MDSISGSDWIEDGLTEYFFLFASVVLFRYQCYDTVPFAPLRSLRSGKCMTLNHIFTWWPRLVSAELDGTFIISMRYVCERDYSKHMSPVCLAKSVSCESWNKAFIMISQTRLLLWSVFPWGWVGEVPGSGLAGVIWRRLGRAGGWVWVAGQGLEIEPHEMAVRTSVLSAGKTLANEGENCQGLFFITYITQRVYPGADGYYIAIVGLEDVRDLAGALDGRWWRAILSLKAKSRQQVTHHSTILPWPNKLPPAGHNFPTFACWGLCRQRPRTFTATNLHMGMCNLERPRHLILSGPFIVPGKRKARFLKLIYFK